MQKKQSLWWHLAMPQWEVNTLIWRDALKQVFPFFLVTHLSMLIISLYAPELIIISSKSPVDPLNSASLSVIWHTWNRYDSQHYVSIAQQSYKSLGDAAFFPLFPWLMRFVDIGIHSTIVSGLLLSSLAGLVLMIVMYQLALEEFGEQLARRAVLYLLAFPTAFFLWAIYPESIFLCLSLLCFYAMKHQRWWLAGVFGLLAALDRPTGILLFLPCCIEYLRVHRAIRLDILSFLLIPLGLGLFALYCAHHYGDPLAFIHAQNGWKHQLAVPGYALFRALQIVHDQGPDIRLRVFLSYSLDFIPAHSHRQSASFSARCSALGLFLLCRKHLVVRQYGTRLSAIDGLWTQYARRLSHLLRPGQTGQPALDTLALSVNIGYALYSLVRAVRDRLSGNLKLFRLPSFCYTDSNGN